MLLIFKNISLILLIAFSFSISCYKELRDAILTNNFDRVKELIAKGTNVNSQNYLGNTPLHDAVSTDNIEMVKLLLSHGANINCRNEWGFTPSNVIASCDDKEMAELLLLENDENIDDINDNTGSTPLDFAIHIGNKEMVKLLLDSGAEVNSQDSTYESTPLHLAAELGLKEIAELLLDYGANKNIEEIDFETPADSAEGADHLDVKELIDNYMPITKR